MTTPSNRRPLHIQLMTLGIAAVVVLLAAFWLGVHEQSVLVESSVAAQLQELDRNSQRVAEELGRALKQTQTSVARLSQEMQLRLEQSNAIEKREESLRLRAKTPRNLDGAYRTDVNQFLADREVGVWLPKHSDVRDDDWAVLAISQLTLQSFGRGTGTPLFVNSWFMPRFGGIAIYWPTEPEFIYRASADFDYRDSDWVRLTEPGMNPGGVTRWTPVSFDEVSSMWMFSAVTPLKVNQQWMGSIGHDVPLNQLLSYAQLISGDYRSHFVLLTDSGQLLASDIYNNDIIKNKGQLTIQQLNDRVFSDALHALGGSDMSARIQQSGQIAFAHRLLDTRFILIQSNALEPIREPFDNNFHRSVLILTLALVVQIVLLAAIALLSWRRSLRDNEDILEAKVLLQTALDETATNAREMSAISYGISHDLRAPLRHMTGFTQLLREQMLTRMNADDLQLVHKIEAANRKATRLIEKLLVYLRTAQQEYRPKEIPLQAMVERVVVEVLAEWPNSRVEWQLNAQTTVHGDSTLLRELFYQLFDNALAAVAQQAHPLIKVYVEHQTDALLLHIADNGNGFDAQKVEHMFEVFQKLDATISEGPGVGLATVRRIVERHGGKISVESSLGKGAHFIVQLPKPNR